MGEQTEHEENDYLHQAGDSVEKVDHRFPVWEVIVTKYDTYYVSTQVPVSSNEGRQSIRHHRHGKDEQGKVS